ncbi:MAG: hypothetical protein IK047_05405, partial [Clostridia bacterium]|nr:hypothetical protein [Clostridia bacterium]
MPLHAVDSSLAALAGRDAEWLAAEYVPVGTAGVDLGSAAGVAAYMKNGSAAGEIPEGYEFAFVAAHDKNAGIQSISADEAVKRVYYNASRQRLFVEYALDGKADALLSEDTELYIVCFGLEELDIGYRTMGFDGALSDAAVNASAPSKVPAAAQSDISSLVSAPMTYPSAAAQYYSYAIGPAGADNASDLQFITDSGDSDSSRPTLVIQHTWKGYRYSVDGANWTDCGYDVQIFVLYFEQQPRIITVEESTLGTSAVSQTGFAFTAVITEYKNGVEQGSPRVISFTLRDGEAKALAVYRRTDGEGNEYVQKAVVTQTADAAFYTDNSSAYGTKNSGAEWEYTAAETPENPRVEFVNTHRSLTVEVHVAMVEDGGVFLRDNYRNYVIEKYSFPLELGAEADLLTALPYNNLFTGDLAKYALGGVVCGTGGDAEGSAVDIGSMDVAKVAYGRVSGNIHELLLKDSGGSDICELGEYKLYYLFYPMPEIRYVEENEDGTLTEIKGSYDGVSVIDDVTYNRAPLTMNGGTVTQAQGITIPVSGFVISQTGGSGCFRMPPLLDDGVFERYLIYTRIAAGSAGAGSIADLGAANVSDGKTLRLQVRNNQLEYSFDGANWRHLPLSGIPTIYAIYTERGYDLQITKTVDVSASGSDPIFTSTRFTVTVESSAITASKYGCTGLGATEISATPASGTQPGIIRFTVGDGSSVKIIGLKRGDYTVTESGNENYDLTAKTGTIISSARVPAAVEDNTKVEFSLDNEMAIDFFNSPKKICKIKDGGTEHVFYKLRDAIAYIGERVPDNTATVEMLSDYRMPAADSVSIPDDYNVTFTTAGDGVYYYQGSGTATVCRTPSLDSSPMFSNGGVLSFANVYVDGGSVAASAPVITSTGSVTVGINAVIKNSVNSGNGGAIYASSGNVTVIGTVSGNTASKGGAVYYSGSGSVSVTGRITGNTSAGDGGGIYAESGNV